jgi:hypothetical protein
MAELKTKRNEKDVLAYLDEIEDTKKRADCLQILKLMQEVTGKPPEMWGDSIVGYGTYHYKYASGREGDWPLVGFSPRKQNITLYITSGFERYEALMQRLGKHTTGKSCLYIKKIEDINLQTLRELVEQSVTHMIESNKEN